MDDCLKLHVRVWKKMFDVVIDEIEKLTRDLLELRELNGCKYLCLVGGFSCSKYLQYRMRNVFGDDTKYDLIIVIPDKPLLSVVKGAAYFGLLSSIIKGEVSAYFSLLVYGYVRRDCQAILQISTEIIDLCIKMVSS